MKVGTINFHRSQNYGALLVTYSLLTYLKKTGISAQAIDYFPEHHTSMYPLKNDAYDFGESYIETGSGENSWKSGRHWQLRTKLFDSAKTVQQKKPDF